jgi:hypothetical protein
MGVGQHGASWVEVVDGALENDEARRARESEPEAQAVSLERRSDWVLLLGFTAMMTVPFLLVAWLMS